MAYNSIYTHYVLYIYRRGVLRREHRRQDEPLHLPHAREHRHALPQQVSMYIACYFALQYMYYVYICASESYTMFYK